jgi:serine/threonine-protein kinase
MLEGREIDGMMGQSLAGCRVTRLIASGPASVVVQATREADGRAVDIKVFHPYLAETAGFANRFGREAQAAIRRRHPNLQGVHSFGVDGPLYFLIMEHLEGESLSHWLAAHRGQPMAARREALALIVPQIGAALASLHGQGTSHGDLKPSNVLIGGNNRVVALDAGVARILYTERVPIRIGTPEYMAPEQVSREQPGDAGADLYALAVICYELVTGQPPFQAQTPGATLRLHAGTPPTPPTALAPELPAPVEAALMRALAKTPAERHPSVEAFLGELLLGFGPPAAPIAVAPLTRVAAPAATAPPAAAAPPPAVAPPPGASSPPPSAPAGAAHSTQPSNTRADASPTAARSTPSQPMPTPPALGVAASRPTTPPARPVTQPRPVERRRAEGGSNLGMIVATVATLLIVGGTLFLLYLILGGR